MIILSQNEDKRLDDHRYSIVNLTVDEFFAIKRALERQYNLSADPDNHDLDSEAEYNIKTEQSFKTAYYNRIKMD